MLVAHDSISDVLHCVGEAIVFFIDDSEVLFACLTYHRARLVKHVIVAIVITGIVIFLDFGRQSDGKHHVGHDRHVQVRRLTSELEFLVVFTPRTFAQTLALAEATTSTSHSVRRSWGHTDARRTYVVCRMDRGAIGAYGGDGDLDFGIEACTLRVSLMLVTRDVLKRSHID